MSKTRQRLGSPYWSHSTSQRSSKTRSRFARTLHGEAAPLCPGINNSTAFPLQASSPLWSGKSEIAELIARKLTWLSSSLPTLLLLPYGAATSAADSLEVRTRKNSHMSKALVTPFLTLCLFSLLERLNIRRGLAAGTNKLSHPFRTLCLYSRSERQNIRRSLAAGPHKFTERHTSQTLRKPLLLCGAARSKIL
jgi:hypothetical protein